MTRTVADIVERLESFKELEDGWYERTSKATNHELIDFVIEIVTLYMTDDLADSWVVGPTGDGGLAFETAYGIGPRTWDIEVHFKPGKTDQSAGQWVLEVFEMDYSLEDNSDYNELEFRAHVLLNETFTELFKRALEKRIFTWE